MRILRNFIANTFLVSLIIMTIILFCSSQVQAAQEGDYTYTITAVKAEITKYTGTGGVVTIPDTLGGVPVTSIGNYAFSACKGLTSISIPQGVTSIGVQAFDGCIGLTNISIPQGVTNIGTNAFFYCIGLTSINLPQGVISIGNSAFNSCTGLTTMNIPQGVTSLGEKAFWKCTGLTTISIPESVTSIGTSAFDGCTRLTSVNVALGNLNYSSIDGVLYNKTRTIIIACPAGITSISIPIGVTSIGTSAFYGCTGLTSISIPQGVTRIGDQAFYGCTGLTSFSIPQGVTSIGPSTFYRCSGLTSIIIPQGVISIGNSAFDGCRGLTSISLPQEVTSIGNSIFNGCTGLTSISLPQGVTRISSFTFHDCTSLNSIFIPQGVISIDNYAFFGCTGLTSISIPQGVTSIGSGAFDGCTGLTSISIPKGVTSIDPYAFYGCTGLTSIRFNSANTTIYDDPYTIPTATRIIGYVPSTAKDYAATYNRTFNVIEYNATPIVQIGIIPNKDDSAGIFVGLKDILDTQGIVVHDAKLASYQIEINYNHNLAKVFDVVNESQMGQIALNSGVDTIGASVAELIDQGTNNFEKLFFVPLTLTGASTTSTTVTIRFTSLSNQNGNQIGIPDVTLTFQRGKIVNDSSQNSLSMTDAVAGLQYLAKIVDAGTDQGKVNVINMASILPPETEANGIKASVKDVIALMQKLVGLRDDSFQLIPQ